MRRNLLIVLCLLLFLLAVGGYYYFSTTQRSRALFELLTPKATGITFSNDLVESPASNVLTYEYFYNGGGVAVGDFNNDGLDDIYLTANMKPNALYINEGGLKFREIAAEAGVACPSGWKTGVALADVNGDGYLDIYVCFSGKGNPEGRRNRLYINNGNLTFTESAAAMGLDDPGHSTHAAFFDYDRDGDLDMYLLNHNVAVFAETEYDDVRNTRDPYAGDKLFRNDNGRFVDVSEFAGIKASPLGFGLGLIAADLNADGWTDLYISNDYVEIDYMYMNNGDGTFTDRMPEHLQHISHFSMGSDVGDINNDALPDLYTVDMLPEDNRRQKLLYGPENYEHFALMVVNGFYLQNMRNMLHLNNGDGTFSEIGQYAGIAATDWSWAALLADYDNDGWKDLFVTNGYFRDYTNQDFLKYKSNYFFEMARAREKADTFHLVSSMTSTPVHNYAFRNNRDLTFSDMSNEWGFGALNFSNGAVYADLDNDGDLDLVINNQNEPASVFRNHTRERNSDGAHYLQILLTGPKGNSQGLGAKVTVWTRGSRQYFENSVSHGFQSSIAAKHHVGLGGHQLVDSLIVEWPDGYAQRFLNVAVDQLFRIDRAAASGTTSAVHAVSVSKPLFAQIDPPITAWHMEAGYNDFERQPLLMSMLSTCGPAMASGDINGDGLADIFVGGSKGTAGNLYFQTSEGKFIASRQTHLFDSVHTNSDALFVDIDNDNDLDLYVVNGGYNDYYHTDPALQDQVYINNGHGVFTASTGWLPAMRTSKSCVAAADFDHDGRVDLFVGGRVEPGKYPQPPPSFLLGNKGDHFENVAVFPDGDLLGMVTDAVWADVDGDSWEDLIVVGEFMNIEVFRNLEGRSFEKITSAVFDKPLPGLWSAIAASDFDKDGDIDFIVGNIGNNTQLRASESEPLEMVYDDFDKDNIVDPILTHYIQGVSYPFATRGELLEQIKGLKNKFPTHESYAAAKLADVFSDTELGRARSLRATILESVYLENQDGKLKPRKLPPTAQVSPLYTFVVADIDGDGNTDFVTAGNQSAARVRIGAIDANFGQVYLGDGKGDFVYVKQTESGLAIVGDVRSLELIRVNNVQCLMVGVNNNGVATYRLKR